MSGGHFCYKDSGLKSEIFGWTDSPENVFEDLEISELVLDVLDLIHDYDWYTCGDTCKETWLEKKFAFKSKWFGRHDERTKRIIDQVIADTKQELYETYGVKEVNNET